MTIKNVLIAGILWGTFYQFSIFFLHISLENNFLDFSHIVAGLAMIYFLRMNNKLKRYFFPLSVSIFILNLIKITEWGYDFLWIPAFTIFIFYSLRLWHKEKKGFLDYLKFLIVIFFVFPYVVTNGPLKIWEYNGREIMNFFAISRIAFIAMFFIYIIESIAISEFYNKNKQTMKKFFIPVLFIQFVIAFGFVIYAVVQQIEADKAREIAAYHKILAEKNAEEARKGKIMAEKEREFFKLRVKILEDSLQELKRK